MCPAPPTGSGRKPPAPASPDPDAPRPPAPPAPAPRPPALVLGGPTALEGTTVDPTIGSRLAQGTADTVAEQTEAADVARSPLAAPLPPAGPVFGEGTRIRQYELIRELGRGGMGQVFLARDTKLARRVALKFLTTGSRALTDRFLVEARTTARCSHDNIVVIHEVDEHEGAPYMVLECLEGAPLRKLLERKRLPASRAVELMVPVVRALVCAHNFGIMHRDLKPENIFVTSAGSIKVLDFGIAKLVGGGDEHAQHKLLGAMDQDGIKDLGLTGEGALVGTMPYMSPEQLGTDAVDHRSDLWAVGIMLFEMVTGKHPLAPFTAHTLILNASLLDQPMPHVGAEAHDLPERLERVIDRCLAKRKAARYVDAKALLDDLEALLPGRPGRQLAEDESPYPGLTAFQEGDADRFFGRSQDVARMVARLREQPLAGIVGPSGVGKSSFVRAGVVPALKASGEAWECYLLRPGRNPLASLASVLQPLTTSGATADGQRPLQDHDALVARLTAEPGYLGTLLRTRAARKNSRILIFIDQFEELYTLVPNAAQRRAFTACLSGVADDAAAPLRIVVSMRSDFLDRVGEDRVFLDELTRGLVFLQPLGRPALREALAQPLDMLGYGFETPEMVEQMLSALESTPGALPLLQFAAARLWGARDRRQKLLTQASYDAMGGVAGTLATHADEVLAGLAPPAQKLSRAVFQRLVTPERTRAIVDMGELRAIVAAPREVDAIVDHLIQARLLVVQSLGEADGGAVEIVHESLITGWPALRRWLDESQDDAAFLAQLRAAAKQWDGKGRAAGFLWRGEAMEEARLWHARHKGQLPEREHAFLGAVLALATRATRIKRAVVGGVIVFLSILVAAGGVALVSIRHAEQRAKDQAVRAERERQSAQEATKHAQTETDRAVQAEQQVQQQLDQIKTEQAAKAKAETEAREKGAEAQMSKEQLQVALGKAQEEKKRAEEESQKARAAAASASQAAERERKAKAEAQALYEKEKAHAERLERERKKITTELK